MGERHPLDRLGLRFSKCLELRPDILELNREVCRVLCC